MRKILIIILLLQIVHLQAQFQKTISINPNNLKSVDAVEINPNFEFSSVTIASRVGANFEGAYVIVQQDTFMLHEDEHDASDSMVFSNLIIFQKNQKQLKLYRNKLNDELIIHFLNAYTETLKSTKAQPVIRDNSVNEPESISQQVWREGLPDPNYERIVHKVHNMILHHSAGSNTDTFYTNIVRNIYLYHTQSLKWSDIGYNYLVAQNGQLYKGRDPDKYDQDNIKGAHFCGSNAGTMGVCVLGNYEEAFPTDTSIITVSKLLAWKAAKDSIDPNLEYAHPLNSHLNGLAAHRDGCATLCPGENLYNLLPEIREMVNSILVEHDIHLESTLVPQDTNMIKDQIRVNYKTRTVELNENAINEITIFDHTGRKKIQNSGLSTISYERLMPGIYFIRIQSNKEIAMYKRYLY